MLCCSIRLGIRKTAYVKFKFLRPRLFFMRIQRAITMALTQAEIQGSKCKLCAKEQRQIAKWLEDYMNMTDGKPTSKPRNTCGRTIDQVIEHCIEISRRMDKEKRGDIAHYHMQVVSWLIKYKKLLEKNGNGR